MLYLLVRGPCNNPILADMHYPLELGMVQATIAAVKSQYCDDATFWTLDPETMVCTQVAVIA